MTEDAASPDNPPAEQPIEPDAPPRARSRIPWWPFIVYAAFWLVLVAGTLYFMLETAHGIPPVEQEFYPYALLGVLTLTLLGPVLAMTTWVVVWVRTDRDARGGLFTISLIRGSVLTFVGVVAWYVALVVADALRLGLIELPGLSS